MLAASLLCDAEPLAPEGAGDEGATVMDVDGGADCSSSEGLRATLVKFLADLQRGMQVGDVGL